MDAHELAKALLKRAEEVSSSDAILMRRAAYILKRRNDQDTDKE